MRPSGSAAEPPCPAGTLAAAAAMSGPPATPHMPGPADDDSRSGSTTNPAVASTGPRSPGFNLNVSSANDASGSRAAGGQLQEASNRVDSGKPWGNSTQIGHGRGRVTKEDTCETAVNSTATDSRLEQGGTGHASGLRLPSLEPGNDSKSRHESQGIAEPDVANSAAGGRSTKRQCLGHAVGPRWAQSLPAGAGQGHVALEHDCEVASIQVCNSGPLLSGLLCESQSVRAVWS